MSESAADNEVFLRGVLGAPPEVRVLPSGDELCVFRVTVRRPTGERAAVDSIDCQTANATARRTVLKLDAGDPLEVQGALRRRFWRGPGGLASRYTVEVSRVRRPARRRSDA